MSKYPIIKLIFLDHFQADSTSLQPIRCTVYGRLAREDDLCYYVLSWICEGDVVSHNSDGYAILKSTVIKLVYLEERSDDSKDENGHKGSSKHATRNRKPVEPGFSNG